MDPAEKNNDPKSIEYFLIEIHQAVSDTTTIVAITVDNRRLGYSSQGPSGISRRKPYLAAHSHFKGSGVRWRHFSPQHYVKGFEAQQYVQMR